MVACFLPPISTPIQGICVQASLLHHQHHCRRKDTPSCPVDSILLLQPLQTEHSSVQRRVMGTGGVDPTGTHSLDLCSADASLKHSICQRHDVPFQSTQSTLPSLPSFSFQEPLCSSKCFMNAASFTSAGDAKTKQNKTKKSNKILSNVDCSSQQMFVPVKAKSVPKIKKQH